MGKRKTSEAYHEVEENTKGLQLDPAFHSIEIGDTLDIPSVANDDNKELWLVQIPKNFPINEKVVWQALTPGAERIHAMCQLKKAGYRLVEEERMSIVPTYAVGGGAEAVRIARRVQIYKISNALTETFGLKDRYMEDEEAKLAKKIAASAQKAEETPVKKEKKEKKDSEKKKKKKKREEEDGGEPDTGHKKKKNKKKWG